MAYAFAGTYGPAPITDLFGHPLTGLTVAVYETGTQNLVNLYTDRSMDTPATNPTLTDDIGNLTFFCAPGQVDISGNDATITVVIPPDPADLATLDGSTFTGPVELAADPTDNLGAATKEYVDTHGGGGGGGSVASVFGRTGVVVPQNADYSGFYDAIGAGAAAAAAAVTAGVPLNPETAVSDAAIRSGAKQAIQKRSSNVTMNVLPGLGGNAIHDVVIGDSIAYGQGSTIGSTNWSDLLANMENRLNGIMDLGHGFGRCFSFGFTSDTWDNLAAGALTSGGITGGSSVWNLGGLNNVIGCTRSWRRAIIIFRKQTNGAGAQVSVNAGSSFSSSIDTNGSGIATYDTGDLGAVASRVLEVKQVAAVTGSGAANLDVEGAFFFNNAGNQGVYIDNLAEGATLLRDWASTYTGWYQNWLPFVLPRRVYVMAGFNDLTNGRTVSQVATDLATVIGHIQTGSPLSEIVVCIQYRPGQSTTCSTSVANVASLPGTLTLGSGSVTLSGGGRVSIVTSAGLAVVAYTATSGSTITGCTLVSGSGSITPGAIVETNWIPSAQWISQYVQPLAAVALANGCTLVDLFAEFGDLSQQPASGTADPYGVTQSGAFIHIADASQSTSGRNGQKAMTMAMARNLTFEQSGPPSGIWKTATASDGELQVQLQGGGQIGIAAYGNSGDADPTWAVGDFGAFLPPGFWAGPGGSSAYDAGIARTGPGVMAVKGRLQSGAPGIVAATDVPLISQLVGLSYAYVVSGCVWTCDSAGSTLNASMTAGTVMVGGVLLTVAAISAHAFTASKDTYVDLQDNGDGTAKVVFTAVGNNADSPVIPNSKTFASNVRCAIITSGATFITSNALINQGDPNFATPPTTAQTSTVASGSNTVNVNTFTGSANLSVAANSLPAAGLIELDTSGGTVAAGFGAVARYTGGGGTTTLTGLMLLSGAGTLSTGGNVKTISQNTLSDSLGTLIFPTSPYPRVIANRRFGNSISTTSTNQVPIAALTVPFTVPPGPSRAVRVSSNVPYLSSSATAGTQYGAQNMVGPPGATPPTVVGAGHAKVSVVSDGVAMTPNDVVLLAPGTYTAIVQISQGAAGTLTVDVAFDFGIISVELV